jgi:hypothetical protein
MIWKQRIAVCLAALAAAGIACNMPSSAVTPTTESVPVTITETTAVTVEISVTPATQPPDSEDLTERLQSALIGKDFETLKSLMGDAFLIQFAGGERGLIAINDAVALLRTDLLSGPDPISFDAAIDPTLAFEGTLNIPELDLVESLFSKGWGAQNVDHAIVLVGETPSGSEYFAGLIYARQGFASMLPTLTAAPPTSASATGTSDAASPNPAPRGAIQYESDFRQGWPIFNDEHVTSQHSIDGYLLNVANAWGGWAFTSHIDIATYYAEIAVTPQSCPESQGSYGLIFNHTDSDEFLVFVVECNGTYTLWERTPTARSQTLLSGDLPASLDAKSGEHKLGVLTEGNNLALYVDDIRLGTVSYTVSGGDFGPYVETTGSSVMSALFTNLSIFSTK